MTILNKIKFWQKLALIIIILLVPSIYMVTMLVQEKNIGINQAKSELTGIKYLEPVYKLLIHVIEYRDLTYLTLSGNIEFKKSLDDLKQTINADLALVDKANKEYGKSSELTQKLMAVVNDWERLQGMAQSEDPDEIFNLYRTLIQDINSFITEELNISGLAVDPALDSTYLINSALITMPQLLEKIGEVRAKSSAVAFSTNRQLYLEEISTLVSVLDEHIKALNDTMEVSFDQNPSVKAALEGTRAELIKQGKNFKNMIDKNVIQNTDSNTGAESSVQLFQAGSNVIATAENLYKKSMLMSEDLLSARIDAQTNKKHMVMVHVFIIFLISILLVYYITRYITGNVSGVIAVIKQISKGNLTIELFENHDKDEISHIFNTLHDLQEKLTDVSNSIRSATYEVGVGAQQVAQGNANLSQRTQEQASSLEEVASSMEQMTGTVSQNADNAQQANQLAISARERADAGGAVVSRAMTAMSAINESSKKIADIISVIDEIAFQTNLLALNAAVEAARAGEQGRGFAVVASEVRNLAGRSATAAKEIKALIQDSVTKTQDGTRLVDESGHALNEIVQAVKKVSDIVAEIAAASREQSEGINQVNKALLQMDDMTQQNAALVEEAAAAAESIDAQSRELELQVEFFKTKESKDKKSKSEKPKLASHTQTRATRLEKPGTDKPSVPKSDQDTKKVLPKLQTEDDSDWQEF